LYQTGKEIMKILKFGVLGLKFEVAGEHVGPVFAIATAWQALGVGHY
jgi:hypothetical protein